MIKCHAFENTSKSSLSNQFNDSPFVVNNAVWRNARSRFFHFLGEYFKELFSYIIKDMTTSRNRYYARAVSGAVNFFLKNQINRSKFIIFIHISTWPRLVDSSDFNLKDIFLK